MAHFYEENGILRLDIYRGDTGNFMIDNIREYVEVPGMVTFGGSIVTFQGDILSFNPDNIEEGYFPVNLNGLFSDIRFSLSEFPGAKQKFLEKSLLLGGIEIVADSEGNEGAALFFTISEEETADLGSGNYVADLEFIFLDGTVQTAKTTTSQRIWRVTNMQDVTN